MTLHTEMPFPQGAIQLGACLSTNLKGLLRILSEKRYDHSICPPMQAKIFYLFLQCLAELRLLKQLQLE